MQETSDLIERETMSVDILIIGAGPAGLATACRLMQLSIEHNHPLQVLVLEKGADLGAHTLTGAVIETRALDDCFRTGRIRAHRYSRRSARTSFSSLPGPKMRSRSPMPCCHVPVSYTHLTLPTNREV